MKRYKGIKKLGPKRYRVRVRITDPRTGERKEVKRVCKGTLEQALETQKQLQEELTNPSPRARVKLRTYAKEWLENRKATIKPSTAHKYENDLRLHILPVFGSMYVNIIRPRDVKAFIAKQLKVAAAWSVANRLRLLRTIAKDALADGLTDLDFCARVRLPRCGGYSEEAPNCLTAAQLDAVGREIPPAWYPLFASMAFTGLRWGEVSALQWADVDHRHGVIRIRRNNWKGTITTPKTKGSTRAVPMVPQLAAVLDRHRERMQEQNHPGLAAGWIFPNARGTLHKGTPMGAILRKAVKRAGLDLRLTPHGLRRTFNDLARRIASGMVVKAITGHITDNMLEHYSMVDAGEKLAVQSAVIRMVEGDLEEGSEGKKSLRGEDLGEDRSPRGPRGTDKPQ